LFFLSFNFALGQKYRIAKTNPAFQKVRADENFDCIHENFDTSMYQWVADYVVTFDTVQPGTIETTFKEVWERANRLGANAYKLTGSDLYCIGEPRHYELSVYWLRMEDRDSNLHLFNSGDVYLFGFLGHHVELDGYEVVSGEEEILVEELTCYHFDMEHDQKVDIRIGSKNRGEIHNVRANANTLPEYLYFQHTTGGGQNAFISTYPWNFAEFLIRALQKG